MQATKAKVSQPVDALKLFSSSSVLGVDLVSPGGTLIAGHCHGGGEAKHSRYDLLHYSSSQSNTGEAVHRQPPSHGQHSPSPGWPVSGRSCQENTFPWLSLQCTHTLSSPDEIHR